MKNEDELRAIWNKPDTRKALMTGLEEKGYAKEQLVEVGKLIDAEKSDLFDVLAYIAFVQVPITRDERVSEHKGEIFSHYDYKQQQFLGFVLDRCIKKGVGVLDQEKLPDLLELKYHAVREAAAELGSVEEIRDVFIEFQQYLYL
ncbi:MAG: type I restriction-modification enzyme R subunit C-terminal domain-containing protein [Woeseiaceae bacterium]